MSSARAIGSNNIGDNAQIHQGDVINNYASAPREPCVLIPFPRNEELIPRQEIISELDRILPLSKECSTAALYGLGGSGKTQIALDYAYRRCQDPSYSVFWVHADSETTFTQDFKSIARKLGLPSNLDGEDLLTAVRDRIETNPPWALILDNVDNLRLFGVSHAAQDTLDMGEHALSLDKFIPRGPRGQVLWTSRDERIAGSLVATRRAIKVPNMTPSQAEKLFDSVRNSQVGSDEAKQVAELVCELEWLPLAVSQAAAYIRMTRINVEEYLSKLKDGKKRWQLLKKSQKDRHRRNEVSNSILETWNISMKHLQIENKTAYQILHIHAFLDNQNIPAEMIKHAALYSDDNTGVDDVHEAHNNNPSSDSNSDDDSSLDSDGDDDSSLDSDGDDDEITEAIARLCDFSLLSIQATGDGNRAYKMHKLVQEAMQYGLSGNERKNEEIYFSVAALEIVSSLFPDSAPDTWNECEKYIAHAQRACNWAILCGRELTAAADLLSRVAFYLYECGRYGESGVEGQKAYELQKTTLGDKHPATILSMFQLAAHYQIVGRHKEAEEMLFKMVGLQQETLGSKHPNTIDTKSAIASVHSSWGKYKEAEGMAVKVLALRREVLGHKHPTTLHEMEDLASIYNILRKYKEEEGLRVEALALQREILGCKHPTTLLNMMELASTYRLLGKDKEADGTEVEVLKLLQEILGDELPGTIPSMKDLAVVCCKLGKYEEAEGIYVKALALQQRILGDKHPETIMVMAELGDLYQATDRCKEAERILIEALALRRETSDDMGYTTADLMTQLGTLYHATGRYKEAERIQIEALALQREVFGDENPETICLMMDLEETRRAMGIAEDAEMLD
ncbi:P-loop containing nucleoside triphosphate hydrolase protein [Trichoderma barbatum]